MSSSLPPAGPEGPAYERMPATVSPFSAARMCRTAPDATVTSGTVRGIRPVATITGDADGAVADRVRLRHLARVGAPDAAQDCRGTAEPRRDRRLPRRVRGIWRV